MPHLEISPGWVMLMAVLYYVNPMGCFWPFCAAAAIHELGHLAAAFLLHIPLCGLRLDAGGAVLAAGTTDYRRELVCALAGPAFNLLTLLFHRRFPMLAALSLLLAVFNLLPVPPLDGGRALRALLLLHCSEARARTILLRTSAVTAAVLCGFVLWAAAFRGCGIWPVLAAALTVWRISVSFRREEKNPL